MRIIVSEATKKERSGVSKSSGKPYTMYDQDCRIRFDNGEVRNAQLSLEKDEAPVQPGEYEPKGSAFYMGKFGPEVSLKPKHWQPVAAVAAVRKVG